MSREISVDVKVVERAKTYAVTFTNGAKERFDNITRSQMEDGVLKLFHRPSPEAAEELVVALVLANVRMWEKS